MPHDRRQCPCHGRIGRLLLVAMTVASLSSATATAQPNQPLAIGDVVRIERHTDRSMTGRVLSLGAGTMELRTQSSIQTVPLNTISKLERRYIVTRGQAAWSGVKRGALITAIIGAILLPVQREEVGVSVGEAAALGAFSGAFFGGLIGAVVGAGRTGERWEVVAPPVASRQPGPSAGGGGLSLSVTF